MPLLFHYGAAMSEVPMLGGLSQWRGRYDALVCDLWGVVHDGRRAIDSACDALIRFRQGGGHVALLSNAPRPNGAVAVQLDGFGVPREAWDTVVTSGDVAREWITRRPDAWHRALGRRCFHLGPPRDRPLLEGLDLEFVPHVDQAEFILCSGLMDDETETAETYHWLFRAALARQVKLLCANPDLAVMRGPKRVPCAGALAAAYAEMGGEVRQYGKPHGNAYALCFERLHALDRARVLAIGDGLHTDIAGAQLAGIDALFVCAGVHAAELGAELDETTVGQLCAAHGLSPKAAIPMLAW